MKINKKTAIIYLLSFIVPVVVMALCFAIEGAFPFGDKTVMTGDTTYQFVDYMSYLKTIVFGNNDFVYSLSKNLGGEMAGFAAYYYYSPLSFLTLLFPSEYLPAGIFLVLILTPGLCSLSMCYVLGKIYGLKEGTLIFSYAYGLMGYAVVYNESFHYNTNLCLLPLVFLGLNRVIDEKKVSRLYVITLAGAIINNYYTGYMICIFCFFYFIFRIFQDSGKIKSTGYFVLSSALAGGMAAFTLLPAVMSLSGEKGALSIGFFRLFNPLDFMSKFYTGSFKGDFGAGLPNIYCGITVVLFFLLYFFNKKISVKDRILCGLVFLFFIVNFCINTFNVVWHGFNRPIGFPHRFAFLFVFFVIIKASESFEMLDDVNVKKAVLVIVPLFLVYSAYLIVTHNSNTSLINIAVSFFFLIVSICILIGRKSYYILLLILLEVADLGADAVMTLDHFSLTPMEEYRSEYLRTKDLIDEIKKRDDGLYRVEKYFRRSHNDALMHDYAGLSHFSSSQKISAMEYMGSLGFRNNGNWAFYGDGNDALTDSMLGIKYILSQYGATGKPYEKIYENENGDSVFMNPYALGLLFPAGKGIYDIDHTKFKDPFELQETIADRITGTDNGILKKIETERTYEDAKKCTFTFETVQDGIVVAYFSAPDVQNAHIYFNGLDYGQYFYTYRWGVIDLGEFSKGTKIEISFESPDGDDIKVDDAFVYNEDFDALERFYKTVTSQRTQLDKITSSHYSGSAELDRDSELVFSVPYDPGWKAYVDGKQTATARAAGDLLGISAGKGKHDVEFRYVSPGQFLGNIISLISASVFVLCILLNRRKYGQK